jgi:hypothetical protein
MWFADDKFCQNAGVDSIIMYINQSTDKIYTVMEKSNVMLYDGMDDTAFKLGYALPIIQGIKYYTVETTGKGFLPEKCSAKLNLYKSTLKIYDDDKCYAKLRK